MDLVCRTKTLISQVPCLRNAVSVLSDSEQVTLSLCVSVLVFQFRDMALVTFTIENTS